MNLDNLFDLEPKPPSLANLNGKRRGRYEAARDQEGERGKELVRIEGVEISGEIFRLLVESFPWNVEKSLVEEYCLVDGCLGVGYHRPVELWQPRGMLPCPERLETVCLEIKS